MEFPDAYVATQGQYSVAERDARFNLIKPGGSTAKEPADDQRNTNTILGGCTSTNVQRRQAAFGAAFGRGLEVSGCELVFGSYNTHYAPSGGHIPPNDAGPYVEEVGNGSDADHRSNARTLDWNGNETLAGKLTLGALPSADMDAVPLVMARPTLLWTNPNVGSGATFAAQTLSSEALSDDITKFSMIHLVFFASGGTSAVYDATIFKESGTSPKGHNIQVLALPTSGAASASYRTVTATDTGIEFSTGYTKTLPDGARASGAGYIIPYKIYGLI